MKIVFILIIFNLFLFSNDGLVIKKGIDEGSVDGKWFKNNYKMLLKNTHVLDIRKPSQREEGYLAGTKHLSINELKIKDFIKKLPKEGIIILTCQSGMVSLDTYVSLKMENYSRLKDVYYLDGYVLCDKANKCEIHPNEPIEEGL